MISSVVDRETQKKIDVVKDRMIRNFGYNDESATDVLNARKSAVDGLIASREKVDPAEAASRLQLAGVTLQASAQVFATLSGSSLLDALRG